MTEISIFDRNFNFWPKFQFLTEKSVFDWNANFDRNVNFWPKCEFLTEMLILSCNFNVRLKSELWPKFQFFIEISIFGWNFNFLTEILICDWNLNVWPNFQFLTEIWSFDRNFIFLLAFELLYRHFMDFTVSVFDQHFEFRLKICESGKP